MYSFNGQGLLVLVIPETQQRQESTIKLPEKHVETIAPLPCVVKNRRGSSINHIVELCH